MYLTGNNTFSGATTISAGTLQLGNSSTIGSVGGNITNGAALIFNNPTAQTYSGTISGTGTMTKSGAGTLTLTGINTNSGVSTIAPARSNWATVPATTAPWAAISPTTRR